MILESIDPGEHAGFARFAGGGVLSWASLGLPPDWLVCADHIVYEKPQIHAGTRNPDSIITLAITAGGLVERRKLQSAPQCPVREPTVSWVYPISWKGNQPKSATAKRVWRALNPYEAAFLKARLQDIAKGLHNNVIDAVGIGLDYLGRL